mmetsp:Transcript_14065/g.19623  ORF Transcript_14065/g.19623 Transcript_14065/m.19623 type:complete len:104 (-) Transcript_14065:162-473(-)
MSVFLSSFSHAYFIFPRDLRNALHQNPQHDYRMNNGTHLSTGVGRTYWSISYQTHGWLVGRLDLRGREGDGSNAIGWEKKVSPPPFLVSTEKWSVCVCTRKQL